MTIHTPKKAILATLLVPAFVATGAYAQAQQGQQQGQQQQQMQQGQQQLSTWNASRLYRNTWSADEMIGTDVRGAQREEIGEVKDIIVGKDGTISKVIVEVGGFLEVGDQHIGVPWKDVKIGRDMQFVQVPLKEVEDGTYSLHGRVPQGEDVAAAQSSWRVNELIGDYADLEDMLRYGLVVDVIFSDKGKAQGVIIERTAGTWGRAGWYGYPYAGYYPGAAYGLPYATAEVGDYGRFDYVQFAKQSQLASDKNQRAQQQAKAGNKQRKGAQSAAGATGAGDRSTGQNLKPWEQKSQSTYDERTRPYQEGQGQQGKSSRQ